MVEIKSIEQLLYFMKGHIHLSRYDEKFIENISTLVQVTTNQVVLLHNLISKYRRQLAKHELYPEKLSDLPWNITVVESSPQYTEGHVSIENDAIYFKCPFNRNFIDEFRKQPLNNFSWIKEKRHYEAPYNMYGLKILLQTANKFFIKVNTCEITRKLLNDVQVYSNMTYWQPTLVKRNGNLFVLASNSSLDQALGDIKLSENIDTFATLSKFGITISEEFYSNNDKLKFICNSVITVEQSDITKIVVWLKELNCDMVYLSGGSLLNSVKKQVVELLSNNNIQHCDTTKTFKQPMNYKYPVVIKFRKNFESTYDPYKVAKVIHIVNSLPIDIK